MLQLSKVCSGVIRRLNRSVHVGFQNGLLCQQRLVLPQMRRFSLTRPTFSQNINNNIKTNNNDNDNNNNNVNKKEETSRNTIWFKKGFENTETDKISLWNAVAAGDLSQTSDLIGKLGPEVRDLYGNTALHIAAWHGQSHLIDPLLSLCVSLSSSDVQGASAAFAAALNDQADTIVELSKHGLALDTKDKSGFTPLHYAAAKANTKAIETLLSLAKQTINEPSIDGYTPLSLAILNPSIVSLLLSHGAEPEPKQSKQTPLLVAVLNNAVESVKLLVKAGASVNRDFKGTTPLISALSTGNASMVDLLLKLGADKEVRFDYEDNNVTPFLLAVTTDKMDCVRVLIKHGADLNATDDQLSNALHHAAAGENVELAEILIKAGVDKDAKNSQGLPPVCNAFKNPKMVEAFAKAGAKLYEEKKNGVIHVAAATGLTQSLETLVRCGVPVNTQNEIGNTPLHYANSAGRLQSIKWLVEQGHADVNVNNKDNASPLHLSSTPECAKQMLSYGIKVDIRDHAGRTPLFNAKSPMVVQALLEAGADVHAKDKEGFVPLMFAAMRSQVAVVEELLKNGANVNETTTQGMTALFHAGGSMQVFQTLTKAGADVNALAIQGLSILHIYGSQAKNEQSAEIIREAIKRGATVDACTESGRTPLMLATQHATGALIEAGANINASDKGGMTPLHYATFSNDDKFFMLLEKGADIKAKDNNGESVLAYATRNSPYLVMELGAKGWGEQKDEVDNEGNTALLTAVMEQNEKGVEALMRIGADTKIRNKEGLLPVDIAIRDGSSKIIAMLQGGN